MSSTVDVLARRVDRLERENLRLKAVAVVVLVVSVSALLMGSATTTKTLEAEEFILRGADGKPRATLGCPKTKMQSG